MEGAARSGYLAADAVLGSDVVAGAIQDREAVTA
jgi:uncharacterized protein with NAD-binding domain and iron-sulfur cluster